MGGSGWVNSRWHYGSVILEGPFGCSLSHRVETNPFSPPSDVGVRDLNSRITTKSAPKKYMKHTEREPNLANCIKLPDILAG